MPEPTSYAWAMTHNTAVRVGSEWPLPTPGFEFPQDYDVPNAEVVYGGEVLQDDEFTAVWAPDWANVEITNKSDEDWPPQDTIAIAVLGLPLDPSRTQEILTEFDARIAKLETEQELHDDQINENQDTIASNAEQIALNTESIAAQALLIEGNAADIGANSEALLTQGTQIAANEDAILSNAEAIVANTSAIAANTAAISEIPPSAPPADTLPLMNSVANPGADTKFSRSDHVHPTDTTRYATSNPAGFQTAAQVTASLTPYALASSVPAPSSTPPKMAGAAVVGTAATWARADHAHPTDTTRYDIANPAGYQTKAQVDAATTRVNVVPLAPVCAAHASMTQAIPKNTQTKVAFDTVDFDTTNAFDAVNHRFKPNVAGYYEVNCGCGMVAGSATVYVSIHKNGVEYRRSTTGANANARLSTLIHLNGTTDYVEGFVYCTANFSTDTGSVLTSMSVTLTQAAAS